jgi:YVTN family beta-propeller protein
MKKSIFILLLSGVVFTACHPDENSNTNGTSDYRTGILFVNEGGFGNNNGSLDFLSYTGSVEHDITYNVNSIPLGDVLQRVITNGTTVFAVLNHSNKVVALDAKTMEVKYEITGIDYPRDAAVVGDRLYVAYGSMQGYVAVYSTGDGAYQSSFPVGMGPERIMYVGGVLWVLNSGGWSLDNTISIVDPIQNQVVNTVTVGDRPVDIAYRQNTTELVVLCSGETMYDANWNVIGNTPSTLDRINISNYQVYETTVGVAGDHPRSMDILPNGNIVVVNGGISEYTSTGQLICEQCIPGNYNSVDLDAAGIAWLTSVSDFTNPSVVSKVNLSTGQVLSTYTAGIGTSAVVFP